VSTTPSLFFHTVISPPTHPIIYPLSLHDALPIYFTTWNGLLTEQNSEEHIKHVYDHDSVITRDELPGFKADVEPDTDENEALEKLQTLIEKAKGYELDQYTEETFTDLSVAIKEAEKLLMYENVTEEQMDDAFVSLQKIGRAHV